MEGEVAQPDLDWSSEPDWNLFWDNLGPQLGALPLDVLREIILPEVFQGNWKVIDKLAMLNRGLLHFFSSTPFWQYVVRRFFCLGETPRSLYWQYRVQAAAIHSTGYPNPVHHPINLLRVFSLNAWKYFWAKQQRMIAWENGKRVEMAALRLTCENDNVYHQILQFLGFIRKYCFELGTNSDYNFEPSFTVAEDPLLTLMWKEREDSYYPTRNGISVLFYPNGNIYIEVSSAFTQCVRVKNVTEEDFVQKLLPIFYEGLALCALSQKENLSEWTFSFERTRVEDRMTKLISRIFQRSNVQSQGNDLVEIVKKSIEGFSQVADIIKKLRGATEKLPVPQNRKKNRTHLVTNRAILSKYLIQACMYLTIYEIYRCFPFAGKYCNTSIMPRLRRYHKNSEAFPIIDDPTQHTYAWQSLPLFAYVDAHEILHQIELLWFGNSPSLRLDFPPARVNYVQESVFSLKLQIGKLSQ